MNVHTELEHALTAVELLRIEIARKEHSLRVYSDLARYLKGLINMGKADNLSEEAKKAIRTEISDYYERIE